MNVIVSPEDNFPDLVGGWVGQNLRKARIAPPPPPPRKPELRGHDRGDAALLTMEYAPPRTVLWHTAASQAHHPPTHTHTQCEAEHVGCCPSPSRFHWSPKSRRPKETNWGKGVGKRGAVGARACVRVCARAEHCAVWSGLRVEVTHPFYHVPVLCHTGVHSLGP